MRIALVDRPPEENRLPGNRFAPLGKLLQELGHEVVLRESQRAAGDRSGLILTAHNRAISGQPLIEAHRAAHQLVEFNPDLVICPLRGGIGQGILMARACGEAFADTRVAIWCDTPSQTQFSRTDGLPSGLGAIISDALERQAMAFADALIMPGGRRPDGLDRLKTGAATIFEAILPSAPPVSRATPPREIEEVVFVGPIARSAGIAEFVEAAQRLSRDGTLGDRTVVFLGLARSGVQGVGAEWLGLSAASWPFSFKVVDETEPDSILHYITDASRLAVAIGDDAEELEPISRHAPNHCLIVRSTRRNELLVDRLEADLRTALNSSAFERQAGHAPTDWDDLIHRLAAQPIQGFSRKPASSGISVCIVHHDRLALLATAIASIPDFVGERPVEIIVLDNASGSAFVEEEIHYRAGNRRNVRIIRSAMPLPQPTILNRGLAQARFDTVLFLDDDNSYLDGGVARLAAAIDAGDFDVVVTPLELFDADAQSPSASVGRLIFLGAAHTAGLFFNGFGDTSIAVRRDAFIKLGGFHDPGYDYPCLDWITLAKAQAAELRIGTLQWPAVRYRRDTARADLAANKLDQEGVRTLVFEAYGDAFDAHLVARYAQKLQLEEL